MSFIMNEFDVEMAEARLDPRVTPNLAEGATKLARLVDWTNRNSDGWPYWSKPSRAAKKLQEALTDANGNTFRFGLDSEDDITAAELAACLRPIKSFLTRHGADAASILG